MLSVSPQLFSTIFGVSRWLFAFFALFLMLFAISWYRTERKKHRQRFRSLPDAGTIGEMVVISGSDQLPVNTWFPVPREGVLGSLRTCDLVVPCPGVHSRHLDFEWQDGTGLLLRPRAGCEVRIDGIPVESAADAVAMPLMHGSSLQVGSAVLRLRLFAALDHTPHPAEAASPQIPYPYPDEPGYAFSEPSAVPPAVPDQPAYSSQNSYPTQTAAPIQVPDNAPLQDVMPPLSPGTPPAPSPENPGSHPAPELSGSSSVSGMPAGPGRPPARRRRADRWKEDWSE